MQLSTTQKNPGPLVLATHLPEPSQCAPGLQRAEQAKDASGHDVSHAPAPLHANGAQAPRGSVPAFAGTQVPGVTLQAPHGHALSQQTPSTQRPF